LMSGINQKKTRHYSRPPLKALIPILFVTVFSVAAFATSVSVAPVTYQNVQGVQFNVTGAFSASSNGFFVSQAAGTASSQPCSWSNGGICQTALVAGDLYYSITLTLNTVPSSTTTYTATVQWNTGSGYSQLGQLTVSVPTTATAGQTMQFFFNTNLATFTAPTGIVVTVA
jgi:hypothetical protein